MYKKELQIGGRTLSIETGAVARQANGACVIRYGDTVVLATACYKDGVVLGDFMPLTVDYKEYTYAGGRIPGGFFKREGRPRANTGPRCPRSTSALGARALVSNTKIVPSARRSRRATGRRRRSSVSCSPPTVRTIPTSSPSTPPRRRW